MGSTERWMNRAGRVMLAILAIQVASPALPAAAAAPVSFRREVVAVLTRAGCNSGTCHGTPAGKNGFRLSLRGFDPRADHAMLTRELGGRRINLHEPRESLILLKPTAQVPHEGGRRFAAGSDLHSILLRWVEEGARDDAETSPAVVDLRVEPEEAILRGRPWRADVKVRARFADGSEHDVTALARFSLSDGSAAELAPEGSVEGLERGETTVVAEYLGRVAVLHLTFLDAPGDVAAHSGSSWDLDAGAHPIDRAVFSKLRLLGIPPAEEASPADFLRRVTLDAIGILPTPDEARRFLADPTPERRAKLIDDLLDRPEFAEFWGMRYADRLGCNQRFVGIKGAYKYHAWVVHALRANWPEDKLAREVLLASGGNYSSAPASFYRRLRDPAAAAENAAQLFLGVRLGCARCHNHPGDRWTQDDYYGMAAFFAGMRFKDGPFFNHLYDKEETVSFAPAGAPAGETGGAEVRHPLTGAAVAPRFLGGGPASTSEGKDRREALADWLLSPENPQFARVATNRIWFHIFGRGIVEPVDDFRVSNPPSNAPLLDALAAEFIRSGFDRKRLIREIFNSRTYRFSSRAAPPSESAGEPLSDAAGRYFSHARVRLLGAESLLDAISQAAGVVEAFAGLPKGFRAAQVPDGEYAHRFLTAFGRPARAMACECERESSSNVSQALHLVGGKTVEEKVRADGGRVAKLIASGIGNDPLAEELFLATLSRFPSEEEKKTLVDLLQAATDRRRAAEDALWALINHPEFLHQH